MLEWKNKFTLKLLIIILFILALLIFALSLKNIYTSLGHKTYTNSLVATATVLLAIATFISDHIIIVGDDKRKKLDDIKHNILDTMKTLVNNNYYNPFNSNNSMFEISDQHKFNSKSIQQILKQPIHSWDDDIIYGVAYKGIINNKLYKELNNHKITKGITNDFKEILDLIKNNSRSYSEKLSELYDKVSKLEDVENLIKRIEQKHENYDKLFLESIKGDYIRLIIVLSLGYDIRLNFPNYFIMAYNDGEYENVDRIANILKIKDDEVLEASSLRNTLKAKVEAFNKKIDEINSIDFLGK